MKTQGYAEVILRFLGKVILIDTILAGAVGLISFILGWRTADMYSTALIRTGVIIIFFAALIGIGGYSARAEDAAAYSLSGAGNMTENLMRIAGSGRSSLGCFFLLLIAGLGLIVLGYLLPVILAVFG